MIWMFLDPFQANEVIEKCHRAHLPDALPPYFFSHIARYENNEVFLFKEWLRFLFGGSLENDR